MSESPGVQDHLAASFASGPFRVCVHRGTRQIGGTCVELECGGARLLLDLGLPLDADAATDPTLLLPDVPGLLALVLSHGHADHWGLAPHAHPSLPAIIGAATRRILLAAAPFVPRPMPFAEQGSDLSELAERTPLRIRPFTVTPYLVDHSAFDAYALLVEAGGRRLFYSGDLRAHGRKAALFERLLRDPPRPVHAMLMEGSSLGRSPRSRPTLPDRDGDGSAARRRRQLSPAGGGAEDGLKGYTGATVSIRHGTFFYTLDERGRQLSVTSAR